MKSLTKLPDEELDKLVAQDDAAALTQKGHRLLASGDLKRARQFFILGSVLGDRQAHIELARIYEDEHNVEEAYGLYARAYAKGDDSVLPNLARILMASDSMLGMEVLLQNAHDGHLGCIRELIAIYKSKPESAESKKELRFWKSKLAEIESPTPPSLIAPPKAKKK